VDPAKSNGSDDTGVQYNCTNELNYFAHTIGLGVRYKTPVGHFESISGISSIAFVCDSDSCPSNCNTFKVGFCASKAHDSWFQKSFASGGELLVRGPAILRSLFPDDEDARAVTRASQETVDALLR